VTIKNRNTEESANGVTGDAAHDALNTVKSSLLLAIDQNQAIAQKMARTLRDVSLQFVNARLEHTGRTLERSRECHGVSELVILQHDWLLDIARDYAELTKRFSEVLQELPQNGIAKMDNAAMARDPASSRRRDEGNDRVAA
jgi:hypothetical protein